jgi:hypothetical protein
VFLFLVSLLFLVADSNVVVEKELLGINLPVKC